jgi:hypothetical protein
VARPNIRGSGWSDLKGFMAKSVHESAESGKESVEVSNQVQAHRSGSEIDGDGVPTRLPVPDWLDHPGLVDALESPGTRWLQAVLRFSRADGSSIFGPIGRAADRLNALQAWADRLGDPSLAAVVAGWRPSRSTTASVPTPPPLPSDSRPDRTLAILRNNWDPRGELVAIDHRQPGHASLLEVAARGKIWIGPTWTSTAIEGKFTRSKPTHWTSGPFAHCIEWTYKVGRSRVTRVAVLLRGRSMALLGQELDGPGPTHEIRLGLSDGIEASAVHGSRALLLSSGRGQPTARLIPLGLPAHDRPTDRGSIEIEGREVVIRQTFAGRRNWLPVLICWGKVPTSWRAQTVAFRSKATPDESAVAARAVWGRFDDDLVVYRSVASPELRCFLGHQTSSRFLVGSFTRSGDVRPIVKIDA